MSRSHIVAERPTPVSCSMIRSAPPASRNRSRGSRCCQRWRNTAYVEMSTAAICLRSAASARRRAISATDLTIHCGSVTSGRNRPRTSLPLRCHSTRRLPIQSSGIAYRSWIAARVTGPASDNHRASSSRRAVPAASEASRSTEGTASSAGISSSGSPVRTRVSCSGPSAAT